MTLNIGIIGAGQAGERHAVGFGHVESTQVVGIADLVLPRAEALAGRFGATAVDDWRRLFDLDIDVLVCCLPHSMHVEPTEAAAQQGVHVLMEKPIATTLDDARRIVDLCCAAKVKLTTSFVHRFRDEVQAVHEWIVTGRVGQPMMARETMNGQRGRHLPKWIESKELAGGGVLMYSAIHGVDRLRWLLGGEVVSVSAQARGLGDDTEVEASIAALLTFDNGAAASLIACAPVYRAQPAHWDTEIYGTRSLARLRTRSFAELSNDGVMIRLETHSADTALGPHYNFARQAAAFAAAIEQDTEPAITGEDGLRALEICLAIYEAAESGKVVVMRNS